jgi:transposase InsO family protein
MFGDIGNSYIGMMVNYGFILNGFTMNGKEPIMPWKENTVMGQRREFVHLAKTEEVKMRSLCRRFDISTKTGYKWLHRYEEEGEEGLQDRSRRPHTSPNRTPPSKEQDVLAVRHAHSSWGGRKIQRLLNDRGQKSVPCPSTITAILHRHGCIDPAESSKHTPWLRFEAPEPNLLWQMDFKGHFLLQNHARCHPLTVEDDHSRYALGLFACSGETMLIVQPHLISLFRTYGLPHCILCDNGQPWGTKDEYRYTKLSVWLIRLGIAVSHSRVSHPQTLGKDERLHRTLRAELIGTKTFVDLDDTQRHFDQWRMVYNFERPHEALALAVPASRYQPSPREFPDPLPPIEYNNSDIVRKVQGKGEISFYGRVFKISKAFAGYPVALRQTLTDGLFDVYFCTQRISTINLKVTDHE